MNSSNYRFSLNLHSTQSQISIPAMLGDTGRTWYINLSDGDKIYFIEDGCLAKLTIKRPTGTYHEEFCEIRENATIVYPFDKNTCATVGLHNCEVILYGINGEILGSPRFAMVVSDRVIRDDDINLSDSDRAILDSMVVEEANRRVAEEGRVSAESARAARFDDTVEGMNTQFGETVEGMNTRFDQTIESMNAQFDQTIEDTNKELGKAVEDIKEEYKIPAIHIGPDAPSKGGDLWIDTDEEEEDDVDIDVNAKVGQVIAVKAVDANGKPTEFKAVDLPVHEQSDWNAAEGEAGHVLNRTHYVDEKGVIHKLPNKFIDADWMATKEDGGSGKTVIIPEQTVSSGMWANRQGTLEEGVAYAVEVNGNLYRCVCHNDGDGTLYLGNGTLLGATAHNNEPFCIAWMGGAATGGMFYNDGTLSAPIGLKVNNWEDDIYNKLPKEFLPDVEWDDVSNKPFVEDTGELLFSQTVTFSTDAAAKNGKNVSDLSVTLVNGADYWLEVNGNMIKCHYRNVNSYTGELYDSAGNRWMKKALAALFVYGQTAGTYTYKLYGLSENIVLDPQYIPSNIARKSDIPDVSGMVKTVNGNAPDENGNVEIETGGGASIDVVAEVGQTIRVTEVDADGKPTKWESADYQPRTHWKAIENTDIFPQRQISFSEGQAIIEEAITLISGSEYTVTFNGTEYQCECVETEQDGTILQLLGNQVAIGGEDTGEPFMVMNVPAQPMIVFADLSGAISECDAGIYGLTLVTHKIDNEYIDTEKITEDFVEVIDYRIQSKRSGENYAIVLTTLNFGETQTYAGSAIFRSHAISTEVSLYAAFSDTIRCIVDFHVDGVAFHVTMIRSYNASGAEQQMFGFFELNGDLCVLRASLSEDHTTAWFTVSKITLVS